MNRRRTVIVAMASISIVLSAAALVWASSHGRVNYPRGLPPEKEARVERDVARMQNASEASRPPKSPRPLLDKAPGIREGIFPYSGGQAVFPRDQYDMNNNWQGSIGETSFIIYAGAYAIGAQRNHGVLFVTSISGQTGQESSTAVDAPSGVGSLRIVSYAHGELRITATTGEALVYDVTESRLKVQDQGSESP